MKSTRREGVQRINYRLQLVSSALARNLEFCSSQIKDDLAPINRKLIRLGLPDTEKDFDKVMDDEEWLKGVFQRLVAKNDRTFSVNADDCPSNEILQAFASTLIGSADISADSVDFMAFRRAVDCWPRLCGTRVQWIDSLGLSAALARRLPVGDVSDALSGVRGLSEMELDAACDEFARTDLLRLVRAGWAKLCRPTSKSVCNPKFFISAEQSSPPPASAEDVEVACRCAPRAPAPLLDCAVDAMPVMRIEHCNGPGARMRFTCLETGITSCPAEEWHFVVGDDILPGCPTAPTQSSPKVSTGPAAGAVSDRAAAPLEKLAERQGCKRARLGTGELAALRLLTGPMRHVYNSLLRSGARDRGRPDPGGCGWGRFEVTIRCALSGLRKLCIHAEFTPATPVWRGLGCGLFAPQQLSLGRAAGLVNRCFWSATADRTQAARGCGVGNASAVEIRVACHAAADVSWLSQFPAEQEVLFLPDTCLRGCGDARLEQGMVVFPAVAYGCAPLPLANSEDWIADMSRCDREGRKEWLPFIAEIFRSELVADLAIVVNKGQDHSPASAVCADQEHLVNEIVLSTMEKNLQEYDELIARHLLVPRSDLNRDTAVKYSINSLLQGKSIALQKFGCCFNCIKELRSQFSEGNHQHCLSCANKSLLALGNNSNNLKLEKSLRHFPWENILSKSEILDFGYWDPSSYDSALLKTLAQELLTNENMRAISICGHIVNTRDGWESEKIEWSSTKAVILSPKIIGMILSNFFNLTVIDLRGNLLGLSGWKSIIKGLENCSRLTLLNGIACKGLTCGNLKELCISNQNNEEGFVQSLIYMLPWSASTLTSLDFRDVGFCGNDWNFALNSIELCTNLLSLCGFRCKGVFPGSLVELDLSRAESNLAWALVKYLPWSCSTLTSLNLYSSFRLGPLGSFDSDQISAVPLAQILGFLTVLQKLHLGGNGFRLTDWTTIMNSLERISALSCLNGFREYQSVLFGGMTALDISFIDVPLAISKFLPRSAQTLTSLEIRSTKMGSEGACALSQYLSELKNLKVLRLEYNDIGSGGASALSPALMQLTNLQTFHLEGNKLGSTGWDCVVDAIRNCSKISSLNGFGLYHEVVRGGQQLIVANGLELTLAIARFLPRSADTLVSLDMRSNFVGFDGALALGCVLSCLTSLCVLRLEGNYMGDVGLSAISCGLQSLELLHTLTLHNNHIGSKGALEVAVSVAKLQMLKELWLSCVNGDQPFISVDAEIEGAIDEGTKATILCLLNHVKCIHLS